MDQTFSISVLASEGTSDVSTVDANLSDLTELFSVFRRAPCTTETCTGKGDPAKKIKGCPHKSGQAWCPATFRLAKRLKSNVDYIHLAVLDLDRLTNAQLSAIPDIPYFALLHSTHSSKPDNWGLRIILPLSRPVTAKEWATLIKVIPSHFSIPVATKEQGGLDLPVLKDPSRLFFFPSAPSDAQVLQGAYEGPLLDPDTLLALASPQQATQRLPEPEDLAPPELSDLLADPTLPPMDVRVAMAKKRLEHVAPAESGKFGGSYTLGICSLIVRGYLVTDLARALEALWDWNLRCLPPWETDPDAKPSDSLLRKIREASTHEARDDDDVQWGQPLRDHKMLVRLLDAAKRPKTTPRTSHSNYTNGVSTHPPSDDEEKDPSSIIYVRPGKAHEAIDDLQNLVHRRGLFFTRGPRLIMLQQPDAPPAPPEQTARDEEGEDISAYQVRREQDAPTFINVTRERVWEEASRHATWMVWSKLTHEHEVADPPVAITGALFNRGSWKKQRNVRGIIGCPAFRPNGSLITEPGWDPETEMYLAPTMPMPRLDLTPSRDRARACVEELLEAVVDFPFQEPVDRAAWLAALLGPILLPAAGCPPLFAITSPSAGSGKGLLAHVIGMIVSGRRMTCTPYVQEDNEMRKRIISHAQAGDQLILVDNLPTGALVNWPTLDMALTASEVSDRLLGTNAMVKVLTRWAWFVTGNNIQMVGDTARRTIEIRISFPDIDPHKRRVETFKHHPLLPWVYQNRSRLLKAALELVLAFFAAGAPKSGLGVVHSFDGWSHLVRDAVVWAGEADAALKISTDIEANDPKVVAHAEFCQALYDIGAKSQETSLKTKQIIDKAAMSAQKLRSAMVELWEGKDGQLPTQRELARTFRGLKDVKVKVSSTDIACLKGKSVGAGYTAWWVDMKKRELH